MILIGLIIIFRRTEMEALPPPGTAEGTGPGTGSETTSGAAAAGPRRLPLGGLILVGLGIAFLLQDMIRGEALPALILIAIGGALLLRHWSTR